MCTLRVQFGQRAAMTLLGPFPTAARALRPLGELFPPGAPIARMPSVICFHACASDSGPTTRERLYHAPFYMHSYGGEMGFRPLGNTRHAPQGSALKMAKVPWRRAAPGHF